jgi:diguanylate cyclase (GGDEF)-like protein
MGEARNDKTRRAEIVAVLDGADPGRRLEALMEWATANDHRVGVLFLDLHGFASVHDAGGRGMDGEMRSLANERLASVTGDTGVVAELGGDEFAVILPGVTSAREIGAAAARARAAFAEPFAIAGGRVAVSAHVEHAVWPERRRRPTDTARRDRLVS